MSQTITNSRGETVQVLDNGDLTWALWKLLGFLLVIGIPVLVGGTASLRDTQRDVREVQAQMQEAVPDQRALRRTMDSLLVELRAARREFSQLQARR